MKATHHLSSGRDVASATGPASPSGAGLLRPAGATPPISSPAPSDVESTAWRSVLVFLRAGSEDGIRCALTLVEARGLTPGPALAALWGKRSRIDGRLTAEVRRRLEATVAAAVVEVEGRIGQRVPSR